MEINTKAKTTEQMMESLTLRWECLIPGAYIAPSGIGDGYYIYRNGPNDWRAVADERNADGYLERTGIGVAPTLREAKSICANHRWLLGC